MGSEGSVHTVWRKGRHQRRKQGCETFGQERQREMRDDEREPLPFQKEAEEKPTTAGP